jgi:hypothetical protein
MRILFDQATPVPIRTYIGYRITTFLSSRIKARLKSRGTLPLGLIARSELHLQGWPRNHAGLAQITQSVCQPKIDIQPSVGP